MADQNLIKPLHGLRGLAALIVVIGHLSPIWIQPAIGVVLFFVLSGFLMGRLYLVKDFSVIEVWRYGTARFARIYPLFAFVIIAAAVLNAYFGFTIFGLETWQVDRHLALLGDALTVWTIAAECHFYAIFLLLWLAFARGKLDLKWLVVLYIPLAIAPFFFDGRIDPLRYLHIFVIGIVVARLSDAPSASAERIAAIALPVSAIAFVLFAFSGANVYANPLVVLTTAILVFSCVNAPSGMFGRMLSASPLIWLGEISFGVYLLHRFAQQFVARFLGTTDKTWLAFSASLALTLVAATLMFRFYEDPMRRMLRSLARKGEDIWNRRRETV